MTEHVDDVDQELEQPPSPAESPPEPPVEEPAEPSAELGGAIDYNDRIFVVGGTGDGKSELLNYLFSGFRCQRVLVDTKDEFAIDGVEIAHSPAEIDWAQPIIHYRDSSGDLDEIDELFQQLWRRTGIVVCVHELADLCEHQPNRTPRWVRVYAGKGRAHGLGLLGGSQRPVSIPAAARTEVQHLFVMSPGLVDPDDHSEVAKMTKRRPEELDQALGQAQQPYSFVWFEKRSRRTLVCGPLPEHLRALNIVRRVADA